MSLNVINLSKTYKNKVTSDLKVLKDISFNLPDNGIFVRWDNRFFKNWLFSMDWNQCDS